MQWKNANLSYTAEVRPVTFESDVVGLQTAQFTYTSGPNAGTGFTEYGSQVLVRCVPGPYVSGSMTTAGPNPVSYNYVVSQTCGRRWTFAQTFMPVGIKYAVRTRRPLQPYVVTRIGYMYSTRPIPVEDAGSFNFVFGAGAGVELFRTRTRSFSLEARYEHFSNKDTAAANPGTDNVVYRLAYSFGR